ncbi:MAG: hypothetical protein KDJ15_03285, partial [Alphaproteobacteria bacterium]|nr:hypothetical protein [Alphaproteobacteria bacterium]
MSSELRVVSRAQGQQKDWLCVHVFLFAFFLFFALGAQLSTAHAQLNINVTEGSMDPLPVAITSFYAAPGADQTVAERMPAVIASNLESSGLFKPISTRAFIQDPDSLSRTGPRFGEWRAINAQALVTGSVSRAADGRTQVEFRLWDVFGEKQIAGMSYTTTPQNWRRIAHIISDEIYKRITGEDGYFDTRIVYIAESGPANARQKRLAIMDQDGA